MAVEGRAFHGELLGEVDHLEVASQIFSTLASYTGAKGGADAIAVQTPRE
jgi:hypothetical protein